MIIKFIWDQSLSKAEENAERDFLEKDPKDAFFSSHVFLYLCVCIIYNINYNICTCRSQFSVIKAFLLCSILSFKFASCVSLLVFASLIFVNFFNFPWMYVFVLLLHRSIIVEQPFLALQMVHILCHTPCTSKMDIHVLWPYEFLWQ